MKISIEWFQGARPQFNVALSSVEGREAFLVIKGCRIVDGSKGEFVSWPATKNETTQKYWNHVYASEQFAAAVLEEARKTAPSQRQPARSSGGGADDSIPF
jgi:DNA-binding cell septation regulator SpoVG